MGLLQIFDRPLWKRIRRGRIVKFCSTQLRPGAINAALWYAVTKLRDNQLASSANWSVDGEGDPVPAEDVAEVEVVSA